MNNLIGSDLNDWIYIYYIKIEEKRQLLIYDRTVSRTGLGPYRAKQRIEDLNKYGYEAFYTIGTLAREPALS